MQCPQCRHENSPRARFCEGCATPLARRCSQCGADVSPSAKFCPECAHPTGVQPAQSASRFSSAESHTPKHLAEKILTSKAALEGERKQVTVLFADLKGSMELLADRDPEEAPSCARPTPACSRTTWTTRRPCATGTATPWPRASPARPPLVVPRRARRRDRALRRPHAGGGRLRPQRPVRVVDMNALRRRSPRPGAAAPGRTSTGRPPQPDVIRHDVGSCRETCAPPRTPASRARQRGHRTAGEQAALSRPGLVGL
jgi:hypothetical protein